MMLSFLFSREDVEAFEWAHIEVTFSRLHDADVKSTFSGAASGVEKYAKFHEIESHLSTLPATVTNGWY